MYVLRFDGPVPAYAWFSDRATGIRARQRARSKGYHVTLNKESIDAETSVFDRDNVHPKYTFADRLRNKFRRSNG